MAVVSRLPGTLNIVLIHGRSYAMMLRFNDSVVGTVASHCRASYRDTPQSGTPFTVVATNSNKEFTLSLSDTQILAMPQNENYWGVPKDFQLCPINLIHRAGRLGFWSVSLDERVLIHGSVAVVGVK